MFFLLFYQDQLKLELMGKEKIFLDFNLFWFPTFFQKSCLISLFEAKVRELLLL